MSGLPTTESIRQIWADLAWLAPEMVLAGAACLFMLLAILKQRPAVLLVVALLALSANAAVLWGQSVGLLQELLVLDGFYVVSAQSVRLKLLLTIFAAIVLLFPFMAGGKRADSPHLQAEYYALLLVAMTGMQMMVSTGHLLLLYLSVELLSIASYILTALLFGRSAAEAGMKYLIFGAASSALMLYGMSLLYGFSGTLHLRELWQNTDPALALPLTISFLLLLGGLLFKLAAVPFHLWAPDVYQAAYTPVSAFLSILPKIAAMGVLLSLSAVWPPLSEQGGFLYAALAVLALASATAGNVAALRQRSVKRMLAYSSVAHSGFLLMPLLYPSGSGVVLFFYLTAYGLMNAGAFFLVMAAERAGLPDDFESFTGWARALPLMAFCTVVLMLALTGLPPTAGFTAKLLVFAHLLEGYRQQPWGGLLWVVAIGALNAAVSLFYYLKLPYLMYFRQQAEGQAHLKAAIGLRPVVFLALLTLPLLLLFFFPLTAE